MEGLDLDSGTEAFHVLNPEVIEIILSEHLLDPEIDRMTEGTTMKGTILYPETGETPSEIMIETLSEKKKGSVLAL